MQNKKFDIYKTQIGQNVSAVTREGYTRIDLLIPFSLKFPGEKTAQDIEESAQDFVQLYILTIAKHFEMMGDLMDCGNIEDAADVGSAFEFFGQISAGLSQISQSLIFQTRRRERDGRKLQLVKENDPADIEKETAERKAAYNTFTAPITATQNQAKNNPPISITSRKSKKAKTEQKKAA